MSKNVIIIGAGIAGIASAIRLQKKGYNVSVYEVNNYPGGKLTTITSKGYRFDAGPSLFTLPNLVDELFEICGKLPTDYFTYENCPIICNYFFEDRTFLTFYADAQKRGEEFQQKLGIDSGIIEKYLTRSQFIYESSRGSFLEKSLHKFSTYFSFGILKTIIAIPRLNLFTTMHKANKKMLKHPKLVQLFDRYATYNGSNPYQAPGILNLIPHLESTLGTYFPKGGMHQITDSLVRLAEDIGVKFNYNQRVDEILTANNKIQGVRIGEQHLRCDFVVCNSDIKPVYKNLLPTVAKPTKILKQEPSSSALIFYWGIKSSFSQLDLHNIFFTEDYQKEFDTLFKDKTCYSDPTIYLNISSKKNPEDAPQGSENWFIMVNVPYNDGQNWEELRMQTRNNILNKLNRILGVSLEELIETEEYLDPIRIEQRTSSFAGALYGTSSNNRMAAFFRHSNFSKVKGLYFVGGSVHPGGGIPLCLYSAKIVSESF